MMTERHKRAPGAGRKRRDRTSPGTQRNIVFVPIQFYVEPELKAALEFYAAVLSTNQGRLVTVTELLTEAIKRIISG